MFFSELDDATRASLLSRARGKTVLLPEGDEPRVREAAQILESDFAVGARLGGAQEAARNKAATLEVLHARAQERGRPLKPDLAEQAHDAFFDAGARLARGEVDAVIGGATVPTAHVIRAALATVGLSKRTSLITSTFFMALRSPTAGGESALLYADGAVMPRPKPAQLSDIAFLAAQALRAWTGREPRVAFLSFSTAGSAEHEEVTRVREAFRLFAQAHPDITAEGEIQFDAATVPDIALRKNPASILKGRANVCVFPDLNAGNIGYKMTQRLAGAQAWGPVMLGAARPFSDLSRGASARDIVQSAILTLALS